MPPLVVIATAVIGAYALARRGQRTWRTLVLALAVIAVELSAVQLRPVDTGVTVQGGVFIAFLGLVFMLNDPLRSMKREDWSFATAYALTLRGMNSIKAKTHAREEEVRTDFAALLERVRAMHPAFPGAPGRQPSVCAAAAGGGSGATPHRSRAAATQRSKPS